MKKKHFLILLTPFCGYQFFNKECLCGRLTKQQKDQEKSPILCPRAKQYDIRAAQTGRDDMTAHSAARLPPADTGLQGLCPTGATTERARETHFTTTGSITSHDHRSPVCLNEEADENI